MGSPDCEGADTSTGDTDVDADTDTDTDADSDADTDADSDADTDADTDADSDSDTDADTTSEVGAAARWAGDTRPSRDGWTVGGVRFGDTAGYSLAVGDLDGDGADDLVAGAPYADPAGDKSGAAFVWSGPVTGNGVLDDGIEIEGAASSAQIGVTVAVGDVTGDGQDDLALASTGGLQDQGSSATGVVYVFEGPLTAGLTLADAAGTWTGTLGDNAGIGLEVVPDQDGDGIAELLVGAPHDSTVSTWGGAAFLLTDPAAGDGELADTSVRVYGEATQTVGTTVCALGDLDGDGFDEIAMSSEGWRSGRYSSAVFVFRGPLDRSAMATDADAVITGEAAGLGVFTQNTGPIGDTDGDGIGDVAVGSIAYAVGGTPSGAVWVVSGAEVASTVDLFTALATIQGDEYDEDLGAAVAGGDLDGDGLGDLLVSAPASDAYAFNGGSAFLYYGGLSGTLTPSDADAGFHGDRSEAEFAFATDTAHDVTGDGVLDLVFGAYGADGDTAQSGAVFVMPGAAP